MKFMKLGSKPDTFQTVNNVGRYVDSELATDVTVIVGDAKFYLHKFPLLSKCAILQKLVASTNEEKKNEVNISEIPGGAAAFEICAKFCYGMTVTLNPYNVVAARCAAEYLGMHETIEKGNLIYKIDVFLNSSIFRSWKDSIIVLQTTKSLLPHSEELKVVSLCIDAIASRACVDVSKVEWSYNYNHKKLPEENGNEPSCNGVGGRLVPKDWWVEDISELELDLYKRVITSIKTKGLLHSEVIGEALKAYAYRRLSGFSKGIIQPEDMIKYRSTIDTIVWLLPTEKRSVSCSFLLKLFKAANGVESGETVRAELIRMIGQQLEEVSVNDLLLKAPEGGNMMYDVDTVESMVREFLVQDKKLEIESGEDGFEVHEEMRRPGILSDASKLMVAKVMDGYLTEIAKDRNLLSSKFVGVGEMVSSISRPSHDGLYRAIDMYLKEHPGISKSERKKMCKLMDCRKLSADACMHAVQNERLPLRVVVQVLFFEQVRASASSGSSTPDLSTKIGSHGSARSATTTTMGPNADEDWDAVATSEELKALKTELAALRLSNKTGGKNSDTVRKVRGLLNSKKVFKKLWSTKGGGGGGGGGQGENNSGSDSSESLGSGNPEEAKSTPSRNRRHSVS